MNFFVVVNIVIFVTFEIINGQYAKYVIKMSKNIDTCFGRSGD